MKAVVVTPVDDVFFTDEIHGADQLHSLKVCAPQFGHHALVLAGVEHTHEDRLDHVVIVVAEGDFVTASFFGEAVEITAAHAGAEIAGGLFDGVDGVKNAGLAEFDGNSQKLRVLFDQFPVLGQVSRIHAEKNQGEGKFVVALQLLEEFGHQHGVLSAGDADGDAVALLHKLILDHGLFKTADQISFEFFAQCLLNIIPSLVEIVRRRNLPDVCSGCFCAGPGFCRAVPDILLTGPGICRGCFRLGGRGGRLRTGGKGIILCACGSERLAAVYYFLLHEIHDPFFVAFLIAFLITFIVVYSRNGDAGIVLLHRRQLLFTEIVVISIAYSIFS